MIDEVVSAGAAFDAVILSVGGGGLLCGVAEGLARNGLGHVPIIAVETHGAASLRRPFRQARWSNFRPLPSIATSLGARKVCEHAFQLSRTRPVESVVVDDRAAVEACLRFMTIIVWWWNPPVARRWQLPIQHPGSCKATSACLSSCAAGLQPLSRS